MLYIPSISIVTRAAATGVCVWISAILDCESRSDSWLLLVVSDAVLKKEHQDPAVRLDNKAALSLD
jgi:hypothetical protein